jgi:putative exporter of polyketide antibiotics
METTIMKALIIIWRVAIIILILMLFAIMGKHEDMLQRDHAAILHFFDKFEQMQNAYEYQNR